MRHTREKKPAILRARCETKLFAYFETVANVRHLDTADIVREALWQYANRTARKYGNI